MKYVKEKNEEDAMLPLRVLRRLQYCRAAVLVYYYTVFLMKTVLEIL